MAIMLDGLDKTGAFTLDRHLFIDKPEPAAFASRCSLEKLQQ
ncbi:uncharacterized protein Dyak_GE28003 [Drosophila yakuba]|uniref:Uncharacterized protein n=1 Tax=Drosophila yakuba TaxID=7245 RepID=A0A0R1DL05_DROYA|nr:uncharacterized protein Dyak_GE28003 [Drosophila yakuba]